MSFRDKKTLDTSLCRSRVPNLLLLCLQPRRIAAHMYRMAARLRICMHDEQQEKDSERGCTHNSTLKYGRNCSNPVLRSFL